MRIAHITDCYLPRLGGIEMHVHDLAAAQRGAGHTVQVLTATGADLHETEPAHEDHILRLGRPVAAVRVAETALAAGGYDVVHAHWSVFSPLAVFGARAAARMGLPTLITVHSMWSGLGPLPRWGVQGLGAGGWPAQWSAVSGVVAGQVAHALGGAIPVRIAPNGVDVDFWRATPRVSLRDEVVIAAVMRFAARKQPLLLLQALREARLALPVGSAVRAVLIGDGPLRKQAQAFVGDHDMAEWVELPGRLTRPQVRDALGRSHIFVAPARQESFGLAALEARCSGLPVLAMRGSGVSEIIGHEREGLLAADRDELVTNLVRLCTEADLRGRIAAHNRSHRPRYDWLTVLDRTHQLYGEAGAVARSREISIAGARA